VSKDVKKAIEDVDSLPANKDLFFDKFVIPKKMDEN